MQCKEMLYRLCSLQTNLHISFHHQSDVLLHQGTTFEELLLSSEILWKKTLQKEHLSSGLPDQTSYYSWAPDASTRGIHLALGQPDPKAHQISR